MERSGPQQEDWSLHPDLISSWSTFGRAAADLFATRGNAESAVVFSEPTGGSIIRSRRLRLQSMAKDIALFLQFHLFRNYWIRFGRTAVSDFYSPQAHRQAMVPKPAAAGTRPFVAAVVEEGCAPPGGMGNQELPGDRSVSLVLASVCENLETLGLPQDEVCLTKGT
ncbi:hypothetical protein CRENBAI_016679 [Crenichthys baileyi]|uniref:Uncharacterized protein n=1 Tax=Crenichthys baileyi TaxID=28760 RepID=A0AAV9RJ93_9TELE